MENEQIQRCALSGERYEDPHFPASDASLGEPPPQPVQWLRPDVAFGPVELFAPGVVARFELGAARLHDCWLLGALATLSTHTALLQRLFVSTRGATYGMYTLQLYWRDEWVQVTVDDRLPCDAHKVPLYVRSGNHGELWPALVEKAWAKLAGSYAALRGGTLPQALRSLTGSVPVRLELAPPAAPPAGGRATAPPRLSWERLLHLLASGAPVALYRNANAAEFEFEWDALSGSSLSMSRASLSPGRPRVEAAESDGGGMLRGLAYPVLQARLDGAVQSVQLSCPWGGQGNSNPNPSPNLNPDLNPNPNPNKGPPPGGSTSARCASTSTRHSRSPSPPQRRRAAPQTAPRTTGCRRADPNPDPDSDPDH